MKALTENLKAFQYQLATLYAGLRQLITTEVDLAFAVKVLDRLVQLVRGMWYAKVRERLQFPPFPSGPKFGVIYADPPWWFADRRNTHVRACGGALSHYDVMKTEEICALPVESIADKDCLLFLWATWPNLFQALLVMLAWGFIPVTIGFVWIKTNKNDECKTCKRKSPFFGIGWATKSNTEIVLLGRRGSPVIWSNYLSSVFYDEEGMMPELIEADRAAHSVKPVKIRERIEELAGPTVRKIEMFARTDQAIPGWVAWGKEATVDSLETTTPPV